MYVGETSHLVYLNHLDLHRVQRSSTCIISLDALKASLKGSLHMAQIARCCYSIIDRYNEHFPVNFADILGHALPWPSLRRLLKNETLRTASTIDQYVHHSSLVIWSERCFRELLSGLEKVGFRTNLGIDGAGPLSLIFATGGGFCIGIFPTLKSKAYFDRQQTRAHVGRSSVGTSKSRAALPFVASFPTASNWRMVPNWNVMLLSLPLGTCECFCKGSMAWRRGNAKSDLVNRFDGLRDSIREICGPDIANKVGPVWGLDDEGEHYGRWRRIDQPHLWIGMGM